jgi:hypothetical protein
LYYVAARESGFGPLRTHCWATAAAAFGVRADAKIKRGRFLGASCGFGWLSHRSATLPLLSIHRLVQLIEWEFDVEADCSGPDTGSQPHKRYVRRNVAALAFKNGEPPFSTFLLSHFLTLSVIMSRTDPTAFIYGVTRFRISHQP